MPPVAEPLEVHPRVTVRDRISVRPSAFDRLLGPGAPASDNSNQAANGDRGLVAASRTDPPMIGVDGKDKEEKVLVSTPPLPASEIVVGPGAGLMVETETCVVAQNFEERGVPLQGDREQSNSPPPEGTPPLPTIEKSPPVDATAAMESPVSPIIGLGGTQEREVVAPRTLAPIEEIRPQEDCGPLAAANECPAILHGVERGPEQVDGNHAWAHTHARPYVESATAQQEGMLDRTGTHARTIPKDTSAQFELGRAMIPETEQVGMGELALSLADIADEAEDGTTAKEVELAALTEGMTRQEAAAFAKLKTFCSNIVKRLAPPLLKEVQASALRLEPEPCTPRRTTRASKRSSTVSVTKATPAENVLLRALGLVPANLVPHEEDVQELKDLFDSPLRDQHVRIIVALFGKPVPSFEMEEETRVMVEAR